MNLNTVLVERELSFLVKRYSKEQIILLIVALQQYLLELKD